MRRYSLSVAILVCLLLAWQISSSAESRWGTPVTVYSILFEWFSSGYVWPHIFETAGVAAAGLFIAVAIAVPLAYFCAIYPSVGNLILPMTTLMNALPRILLVPIFIAGFGIGVVSKLSMVIAMTMFLLFFEVYGRLLSIPKLLLHNLRLLGAQPIDTLRHVYIIYIVDGLVQGMRSAIGFALIGAIISEYMGAIRGVGYVVDLHYGLNDYDGAICGLLIVLAIALVFNMVVRFFALLWSTDQ